MYIEHAWFILEPGRPFIPNWHIDATCDHLQAVHDGYINRLLINVPPGAMKSLTTDVFFPSWEWGPRNAPWTRYVSWSYSEQLTVRDNRKTRILITHPWYRMFWGDRFRLVGDQNAKTRFENDRTGFKIASSVGGLGTGERGDRCIVDDPHNVKDGESEAKRMQALLWFTESLPTRVNDPVRSAIVVIMQRIHEQDVSGEILARELGYTHLCLPMEFEPKRKCITVIRPPDPVTGDPGKTFEDPRTEENDLLWPARMPRETVERDKKTLGMYAVAGQFQQRPSPRGGGMFKTLWWRWYKHERAFRPEGCDTAPAVDLPNLDWQVISVDAAFKKTAIGSRVGILVIGGLGANRYVLDNRTAHMTFKETCDTIKELRAQYPRALRILVEDKANGPAIVDTLSAEIAGVIAVTPEGGKEARASAIQPAVEAGNVFLPEGAAWLDDFVGEFSTFPAGARDDQVDALSQALIYMTAGSDMIRALMLSKL
jgi:predicted phage terminase large subunit-like protein